MTDLTVDVVRTIDQVDVAEWDALCHGRSFVDHRWLRLAESILVDYEPRYVLLRHRGRLAAAAICAVSRRFGNRSLQRRLGWILRPFAWLRCAVPLSSEPGIVLAPSSDSARMVAVLLAATPRLMLRERALFLTVDGVSSDGEAWSDLRRTGLRRHSEWTDFTLALRWGRPTSTLLVCPPRTGVKIRRILHRAERERISVERLQAPEWHAERFRALIGEVLTHHGTHDPYVADLVPRLARLFGDDAHALVARRAGAIVGCAILLRQVPICWQSGSGWTTNAPGEPPRTGCSSSSQSAWPSTSACADWDLAPPPTRSSGISEPHRFRATAR